MTTQVVIPTNILTTSSATIDHSTVVWPSKATNKSELPSAKQLTSAAGASSVGASSAAPTQRPFVDLTQPIKETEDDDGPADSANVQLLKQAFQLTLIDLQLPQQWEEEHLYPLIEAVRLNEMTSAAYYNRFYQALRSLDIFSTRSIEKQNGDRASELATPIESLFALAHPGEPYSDTFIISGRTYQRSRFFGRLDTKQSSGRSVQKMEKQGWFQKQVSNYWQTLFGAYLPGQHVMVYLNYDQAGQRNTKQGRYLKKDGYCGWWLRILISQRPPSDQSCQ